MGQRVGKTGQASRGGEGRRLHYQPLLILLAPLCLGAIVDRYWFGVFSVWLLVSGVALVAWASCWLVRRDALGTGCLVIAVVGVGGAWHHARWSQYFVDDLVSFAESESGPVVVDAVAMDGTKWISAPPANPLAPRQLQGRSRLKLRVIAIRDGSVWRRARGRVSLTVRGRLQPVQVGDSIRVFAFLTLPSRPRNPGEFNFAEFLRTKRELCSLSATCPAAVRLRKPGSQWSPLRWIPGIRLRGQRLLTQYIQPVHVPLASALLLGTREQLEVGRAEMFLTSGTIHLLSISGLHIGILAGGVFLLAALLRLSQRATFVLVVAFVISYALITDARPPVIRAAILIVLACCARLVGRHTFGLNLLAGAGMLVFALHPAHLFQVGTQLSFLAVATLISIASWLQWRMPEDPLDRLIVTTRPVHVRLAKRCWHSLRQLCSASFIVWLVALPLVMYHFHIVSLVGLALNPMIWMPISVALFSGFILLLSGGVLPSVAGLCGSCCSQSLGLIEYTLQASQSLPGNHCWTAGPAAWWMCGHYLVLAVWLLCPLFRPRGYWLLSLGVSWITIGFLMSPGAIRERAVARKPQLVCTFISVGHGTCVLIECPDGSNLLYDAGHLGSPIRGARKISAVLWSRGITHLDAIVLSHADLDHYNAIPELLKRFEVGEIYVSPMMFQKESPGLEFLQEAVRFQDIGFREVSACLTLHMRNAMRMVVLHPPVPSRATSDNANSVVLLLQFAGRRILLPGDIEGLGLATLLQGNPIDCDIVMAPHHGSPNSRPRDFQQWSRAEWMVVSSGHERTIAFAEPTVCVQTIRGAVQFLIDADGSVTCQQWAGDCWQEKCRGAR